MKMLTFRISNEEADEIRQISLHHKLSKSNILRHALKFYLDEIKKSKKKQDLKTACIKNRKPDLQDLNDWESSSFEVDDD